MTKKPSEWSIHQFMEVCRVVEGQVDPKQPPYANMPHIGPGNIEKFSGKLSNVRTAKQDNQISGKYLFSSHHVIYGKINPQFGKVCFPRFDGVCSADAYPIECIEGKIIPDFLLYGLLDSKFTDYAVSVSGRTGMPKINRADLDLYEFLLPPLSEQKKIAEILASVDRVIELTSMEIDKLKDLKKGMMQELLTRGVGHTKFKDSPIGKIPESWEYGLIDSVTSRRSGHTPDKEVAEYWNGNIQWISLADSSRLDNLHISESERYITHKGIENSSAVLMPAGVVVMTRDAGIGKSAISLNETTVSQHFMAWECNEKKLNNYFLYYQLQYLKPVFEAEATGTTIKTIGLPFFKKFKICIPPIGEQIKIKDSLLSVDRSVFKLCDKLRLLTYAKKGLMDDLLTGKVRVKV